MKLVIKVYEIGDIVSGEVTGIEEYGFFVALSNGYTGLVHISEVSDFYVASLEDLVQIGDKVDLEVLSIENKKIKLSYKSIRIHMKKGHSVDDLETRTGSKELLKHVEKLLENSGE